MYYLYLDESGASRDIHELIVNSNEITCKFFTIGGIIVDSEGKVEFKKGYDTTMRTFFDFELTTEDMQTIASLDLKTTSFFDHRDPKMVKLLSLNKVDL